MYSSVFHFKNVPEYLKSETARVFIYLKRFLLQSFFFLVQLYGSPEIYIFLIYFFYFLLLDGVSFQFPKHL